MAERGVKKWEDGARLRARCFCCGVLPSMQSLGQVHFINVRKAGSHRRGDHACGPGGARGNHRLRCRRFQTILTSQKQAGSSGCAEGRMPVTPAPRSRACLVSGVGCGSQSRGPARTSVFTASNSFARSEKAMISVCRTTGRRARQRTGRARLGASREAASVQAPLVGQPSAHAACEHAPGTRT